MNNTQRLQLIDAVTRVDAKNARAARLITAQRLTAKTYSPEMADALRRDMLRTVPPVMTYLLSLLPPGLSVKQLCQNCGISESTYTRLGSCDRRPSEDTLDKISDGLALTAQDRAQLHTIARAQHTRFDCVMYCCLDFPVYEPQEINALLAHWLSEKEQLYSPRDLKNYAHFEQDYLEFIVLCQQDPAGLSPEHRRLVDEFRKYPLEISPLNTALIRFICKHLRPPMRPGHLRKHCTIKEDAWENLNNPAVIPSDKTLWKAAIGLQLNVRDGKQLFDTARNAAKEEDSHV